MFAAAVTFPAFVSSAPPLELLGNVQPAMRRRFSTPAVATVCLLLAGCGGGTTLIKGPVTGIKSNSPQAGEKLGFPAVATKNTTRVAGSDETADAAGVALAVYPSNGAGTHPTAVTIAPTDDWQAAIASAVLMAPPIRAPVLLSGSGSMPSATSGALKVLAPTGAGVIDGRQVIRVGDVPTPGSDRSVAITGKDPYALAAAIDRFASAVHGRTSANVLIAAGDNAPYAMPAAGFAAESGEPILFVTHSGVPTATRQALLAHQKPHIYVLGPSSVIPDSVLNELGKYGTVKRIGSAASDPASNSVAFAEYRDPACPFGQACAHVPGSFGWALRGPGHGYVLLNAHRPLDAAAAAPLSGSGDYGPQLLVDQPSTLPGSVLTYFLDYATPGYNQEGPTAAVYNHGWVIGDQSVISVAVQAQMDLRLEVVPQTGQ
jgi:hypothetical protein